MTLVFPLPVALFRANGERVRVRGGNVEVDGSTHGTDAEIGQDTTRTAALQNLGYRVFRVHNIELYENVDGVLDTLLAFVESVSR